MLCGYSSIALQTFSSNLTMINSAVTEKPSRLWWSYRFTLHNVFSLWKGETELGLLTAGNEGSGAGSELVMMAAVHLMSVRAKEEFKQKKKQKKRKRTDRRGTCETPSASSAPVQICVENATYRTLICFSPQNEMKWRCIYSNVSYHWEMSQWPWSDVDVLTLLCKRSLGSRYLRLLPGV